MNKESDFILTEEPITLIKYIGQDTTVVLPEDLYDIKYRAFDGTKVESLIFPESAFCTLTLGNIPSLREIHLTRQHIWEESFVNCPNIEVIEISLDTRIFGSQKKNPLDVLTKIKPDASGMNIQYCVVLKADKKVLKNTVVIPEGVKRLVLNVFKGCTKVKEFILPESLEMIDEGVFQDCTGLEEIIIPEKVTFIDDRTFQGCKALKKIKGIGVDQFNNIFGNTTKAEQVIPLIFPKISIAKTRDRVRQLSLAMGYVLEPDLYPKRIRKSYDQFIVENSDELLEKASQYNLNNVISALAGESATEINCFQPLVSMSVADAKELFETSRKETGLKIWYYKGNEKIIDVPYKIGKTDVITCHHSAFKSDAIVRCNRKLFRRLPLDVQINDYIAAKKNTVEFSAEQKGAMEEWFQKSFTTAIKEVIEKEDAVRLHEILDIWQNPTEAQLSEIISLLKTSTPLNAVLIEFVNKHNHDLEEQAL